jgi:hypothetical protein
MISERTVSRGVRGKNKPCCLPLRAEAVSFQCGDDAVPDLLDRAGA